MRSRVLAPVIFIVLTMLIGCGGPYLKKSDELLASTEPQRALLTTAAVDANACKSGVSTKAGSMGDQCGGGLASVFQSGQLDDFGEIMISRAAAFLAAEGIELYIDPAHAKLATYEIAKGATDSMSGLSQVAGLWLSKDGSNTRIWGRPIMKLYGHVFKKLDTAAPKEAFVFIDGRISKKSAWFGFWKKPRVEVDIGVYDEDGKPLLQSRTVGYGKGSFLFVNQSAKNLELAMTRGLDSLASRMEGDGPKRVAPAVATATEPGDSGGDTAAVAPTDPVVADTPSEPQATEVADNRPFDPNAPPPRSLADRPTSSEPTTTRQTAPSGAPPRSLADRGTTTDPNAAPRRSLADTTGGEAPEKSAPEVTERKAVKTDTAVSADFARHRLGLALRMGFGGNATPVYTKTQKERLPDGFEAPKSQLAPAGGAFAQYEFVVHPVFSVGGRAEFFLWRTEFEALEELGRHKVLNINPLIRLRAPVRSSLVYLGAMIGPSFTFPSESLNDGLDLARARMAWNYGLVGGVEILGNSQAPSVFVEGGYSEQQVRYRRRTFLVAGADEVLRMKFWELGFNVGVTYGF